MGEREREREWLFLLGSQAALEFPSLTQPHFGRVEVLSTSGVGDELSELDKNLMNRTASSAYIGNFRTTELVYDTFGRRSNLAGDINTRLTHDLFACFVNLCVGVVKITFANESGYNYNSVP